MNIVKDKKDNIEARLRLLAAAEKDKKLQQLLIEKCSRGAEGCLFWINYFVWLYEPRSLDNKTIPFLSYPYQDETIEAIIHSVEHKEDLFIDKSRDMGVTWIVLTVFYWGFLFKEWSTLAGSRKQEEVDTLGDMSTLFPKLRYIHSNLPHWMRIETMDAFMRISAPLKNNSITGESTNENFGTGGRYNAILFDEHAKWGGTAWAAWTSAAQATPCRISVSTPFGSGTKQAELRESEIKQLHLHWTLHPEKKLGLYDITQEERDSKELKGALTRSPWYDSEALRMTVDEIAQELDINYEQSAGGRVYGQEWDQLVAAGRLRRLSYDPDLETFSSWDFGIGDATSVAIIQVSAFAEEIYVIDHYENNNQKIEHFYDWLIGHTYNGEVIPFSAHYGDISGRHRELTTGRSVFEWFNDRGITVISRKTNEIDEKHGVQMALPRTFVDDRLTNFIKSFNNFHYEYDLLKGEYKNKPHHDKFSHTPKMFAYFCVNHFEPKQKVHETSLTKRMREIKQKEVDSNNDYTI